MFFEYVEQEYSQEDFHVDLRDSSEDIPRRFFDNEYEQDHTELNNFPK